MSIAIIALKLTKEEAIPNIQADYIGVDKGTLTLLKAGYKVKYAMGDFDSVTKEEMKYIEENVQEVIHLNPIKDDTDSEAALNEALQRGYEKILFLGGLQGRMDHAFVNIQLAYQHPQLVKFIDEQNMITALQPGQYPCHKDAYCYFSFFTERQAEISLNGFAYPLSHRLITNNDIFTVSNELVGEEGTITIHQGIVLMMQTRDTQ